MFKAVLISLASGGVVTSLAEYFFKYNLIDLVVEKVKGVLRAIGGVFKKNPPTNSAPKQS